MTQKKTSKKVKILGYKTFVNSETGESVDVAVTKVEERDFNFTKVWLSHLLEVIEELGSKKIEVAFWIMNNLNKENQLIYTQRQIAEKTKTSLETVNKVMKCLQKVDFLRKFGRVYVVNPDMIYKGSRQARMNLLMQYNSIPEKPLTDDEKLDNIHESIKRLQSQIEHLNHLEKELQSKGKQDSKVVQLDAARQ